MFVNMEELLKEGSVLGIALGQPESMVREKFSEPDDVLKNCDLVLSKYDGLEFTAQKNSLVIINFEFMDGRLNLPNQLTLPDEWQNKDIHHWVERLEEAEIGWHICSENSYDDNLVLVTEGNVLIYYSLIYKEVSKVQSTSLNKKLYRYEE